MYDANEPFAELRDYLEHVNQLVSSDFPICREQMEMIIENCQRIDAVLKKIVLH